MEKATVLENTTKPQTAGWNSGEKKKNHFSCSIMLLFSPIIINKQKAAMIQWGFLLTLKNN